MVLFSFRVQLHWLIYFKSSWDDVTSFGNDLLFKLMNNYWIKTTFRTWICNLIKFATSASSLSQRISLICRGINATIYNTLQKVFRTELSWSKNLGWSWINIVLDVIWWNAIFPMAAILTKKVQITKHDYCWHELSCYRPKARTKINCN